MKRFVFLTGLGVCLFLMNILPLAHGGEGFASLSVEDQKVRVELEKTLDELREAAKDKDLQKYLSLVESSKNDEPSPSVRMFQSGLSDFIYKMLSALRDPKQSKFLTLILQKDRAGYVVQNNYWNKNTIELTLAKFHRVNNTWKYQTNSYNKEWTARSTDPNEQIKEIKRELETNPDFRLKE